MYLLIRYFFLLAIVRPISWIVLGISVRQKGELPSHGPAIIIANHNSHLDTIVLMSLFPLKISKLIRPVAAEDYFLKNRFLKWFSEKILNIIPIGRNKENRITDPIKPISDAISNGDIVIFYPEGTRGEPERLAKFKSGIARIAERHPEVPLIPIFIHGLGKSLPKGEFILVPFICDIVIGDHIKWSYPKEKFLTEVEESIFNLAKELNLTTWE